jgi:hypothetical protein
MILFEGVHPLEGGAFRLKFRRDRRSEMKIENPLVFYPRYGWETLTKVLGVLAGLPPVQRRAQRGTGRA